MTCECLMTSQWLPPKHNHQPHPHAKTANLGFSISNFISIAAFSTVLERLRRSSCIESALNRVPRQVVATSWLMLSMLLVSSGRVSVYRRRLFFFQQCQSMAHSKRKEKTGRSEKLNEVVNFRYETKRSQVRTTLQ